MKMYTIGHSNHSQEEFLHLLEMYEICSVIDVRSIPASKHSPQYNKDALEGFLRINNIDYHYFGKEFGAHRFDALNEMNQVDFELAVNTELFHQGVDRLVSLLESQTVVLMCSEANPLDCHRFALIARYFHEHGFEVSHILKNGELATHQSLEQQMINDYLHIRNPKLPEIDELFGTYTAEEQRRDAYRLKNEKIGYRIEQQEEYCD